MSIPTTGESFAKLIEYIRKAQEEAATLAHLHNANDQRVLARGWLSISEMLKKTQHTIIQIASGKMH